VLAAIVGGVLTGLTRLLTGAQARWLGCGPTAEQRIYFANHQSHGDFVLLWATLPPRLRASTRPVAGSDYWLASSPRRFLITRVFRGVLVDRRRDQRTEDPLAAMRAALDAGDSLILFPEGTRNPDPTAPMQPFKSGLWHLAQAAPQVALVPTYIENIGRVLPKGHVLPVPLLCSVRFGAPLERVPGEPKDAFLVRARAAVEQLGARADGAAA
jgi:1-acyl-sn-glycerol-3-phosphate acyltransferase